LKAKFLRIKKTFLLAISRSTCLNLSSDDLTKKSYGVTKRKDATRARADCLFQRTPPTSEHITSFTRRHAPAPAGTLYLHKKYKAWMCTTPSPCSPPRPRCVWTAPLRRQPGALGVCDEFLGFHQSRPDRGDSASKYIYQPDFSRLIAEPQRVALLRPKVQESDIPAGFRAASA
jgi:hypothetical protein